MWKSLGQVKLVQLCELEKKMLKIHCMYIVYKTLFTRLVYLQVKSKASTLTCTVTVLSFSAFPVYVPVFSWTDKVNGSAEVSFRWLSSFNIPQSKQTLIYMEKGEQNDRLLYWSLMYINTNVLKILANDLEITDLV